MSALGVTDGDFHYLWNEVLRSWFPGPDGWKVRQQRVTDISIPAFEVNVRCDSCGKWTREVIHPNGLYFDEKLVILGVVKSEFRWGDEGRKGVLTGLKMIMQDKLLRTGVSVVWGIAAIGWHWMAVKKDSTEVVQELIGWKNNVLSLESWRVMKEMTDGIKESV